MNLSNLVELSNEDFAKIPEQIFNTFCTEDDALLFPYLKEVDVALSATISDKKCFIYDTNPLTKMLYEAKFFYPSLNGIRNRLREITIYEKCPDTPISKYFEKPIYNQIISFKLFLQKSLQDPTNIWIAHLCVLGIKEAQKIQKKKEKAQKKAKEEQTQEPEIVESQIKEATPQEFNFKNFIVESYKNIYTKVELEKILISHFCRPFITTDTDKIDEKSKHGKFSFAYYSPYKLDIAKTHKEHIFSMWFYGIRTEALKKAFALNEQEWDSRYKKDFAFIHKRLKSGGIIMVEKNPNEIQSFIKMTNLYGYQNIKSFISQDKQVLFLLKKL